MKLKLLLGILVFAVLAAQMPAIAGERSKDFKRLSFDEFFAGQVRPLPLSMEIPAQYTHAKELDSPASYSYWMKEDVVATVAKGEDLSAAAVSGFIYGKLSLNEGFDRSKSKFLSEDNLEAGLRKEGMELLQKKRSSVAGFPILSFIVRADDGTIACSLYVATLVDTNVLYFAYRPPNNDLEVAKKVWAHIVASLKSAPLPPKR